MQIIEIPAGSRFIAAWELGRRIGALLRPVPETPPLLAELRKKIAEPEPQHYRLEELGDEDVMYLRRIWAELDVPDALNMTPEQWSKCKAAFQAAPDRPAWDLYAGFRNYAQEAKSAQFEIASKHIRAMNELIRGGKMRAYDADLAPVPSVDGWGTQVRVSDARTYLAELGIELRESSAPDGVLGIVNAMNQSLAQQASEALAAGYRAPEGPYRRVLPSGKRFFTVSEATLETARALHPEQPDDPNSAMVTGFFVVDANGAKDAGRPAEEHASELDEIWLAATLPPPVFPMAQSTFDVYALALSASKRGRTWTLRPLLRSRKVDADILCAATRIAHEELLRHAVAAAQVTLLHPATKTPIGVATAVDAALIRRDDLVKFAASMPVPLELVDQDAAEGRSSVTGNAEAVPAAPTLEARESVRQLGDWKVKAREIAKAKLAQDESGPEGGTRGTLPYYSQHVEKELRRLGIKGARGEWLTAENIKREALQGVHWWNGGHPKG